MATNENEQVTQPVQSTSYASSSTALCTLPYPSSGFPNTYYKSAASMELIKTTLLNSDLCSNLEPYCINFMADKMVMEEYLEGEVIIEEGSPGGKLYIIEYGLVQVSRNGEHLCYLSPGKLIGELAVLFNWHNAVTFTCSSDSCYLWAIDGDTLQNILKYGWKRQAYVDFMTSLPLFKLLPEDRLIRLSWHIGEQEFMYGEYIIRQGTSATSFFVIQRGRVKVTMKEREDHEKFVRVMHQGEFFGEKGLLMSQTEETGQSSSTSYPAEGQMVAARSTSQTGIRTANVIVDDKEGVTCLVISREAFFQFFRGLEQQVARKY